MDYKTFVKEEFLKHKNSGLSAPQIMKQAGAKWSEYKNGHAGKAPKAKAVKKVKGGFRHSWLNVGWCDGVICSVI